MAPAMIMMMWKFLNPPSFTKTVVDVDEVDEEEIRLSSRIQLLPSALNLYPSLQVLQTAVFPE